LNNPKEISYKFDDFGINNQYLKGFVFKYSDAKAMDSIMTHKKFIQDSIAKREQFVRDSLEVLLYNQKLDSVFQDYNKQFLSYSYNINKENLPEYEKVKSGGNNESNYKNAVDQISRKHKEACNLILQKTMAENPKEYIQIYLKENPVEKIKLEKKYLECRCNFSSYEEFFFTVQRYTLSRLGNCTCRNEMYLRHKDYFTDQAEFDTYYDEGDDAVQLEIIKRRINHMKIEKLDLQDAIVDMQSPAQKSSVQMLLNFNNVRASSAISILSSIVEEEKLQPYYPQIIDYIVEKNSKLNKEWSKNGPLFKNKVEFYHAYISGNYK
jgi:hypothetical protein